MAWVMFGTKLGDHKRQCSGLPDPWYLSLTPGALPFCPSRETNMPQREQAEAWETPHPSLPGAEHREGTRWARGWHHPLPPCPVYSNKHVLLPPLPLPGLWFGLNPSLQVDTPGGEWAVEKGDKGWALGCQAGMYRLYISIYNVQTDRVPPPP